MRLETEEKSRKERLFEAAQELMLEKGYVATTIDEICEKAAVTKGSFFYYFKNKEELGQQLIPRFSKMTGEKLNQGACCEGDDPLDKAYALIDCATKMAQHPESKGCLVGIFAQELSTSHPEIRNLCAQMFQQAITNFKELLLEAKKKYKPNASFDVKSLAEQFLVLVQGSLLLTKASQDRGIMERTFFHYKEYLKSLFGR